ncbi:MAG: AMP-binding protein, partial [Phycisphaerae bacterium]
PPGASRDIAPEPASVSVTQPASILFTSGTTVQAKAVPLTHRNLISNARALLQVHRLYPSDELLSVLPMYHAFEFTGGFLCPFASGATITYLSEMKGNEIRNAMIATGTTVMLVVPRLLQSFLDAIELQVSSVLMGKTAYRSVGAVSELGGQRLGRLLFTPIHNRFGGHVRMFVSGGSRLEPSLWQSFERMGFPVYEGYGLTETSPVLSVNPPGAGRPGTVGKMLPNIELEIRNQNLEGIGEIWVKGPSVMSAYCNNDEATKEVIVDGWFDTGDLGLLDDNGYLTITGRSKDLIVTSAGKNVYPDEVEFRYRELPFVKEICVFGMSADDGVGDTVHAVVVLDTQQMRDVDFSSAEREVRMAAESISETLPPHQRITTLHFWEHELPKTSTLKAKRGLVRERVLQDWQSGSTTNRPSIGHDAGPPPEYENVTFPVVRKILAQQTKRTEKHISRDAHLLLDLGIDSIGKINVIGEVESHFSMEIDDETATKAARVCDLLAIIGDRQPTPGKKRDPSHWRKRIANEKSGNLPKNGHLPPHLMPIRWMLRGGVGLFMKTYVRVRTHGLKNIPDKGAFILAPNHSSHLDSPSVLEAVSGKRRVWVAGAQDYFFNTAMKRFVFGKVLDTIAFDRKSDGVEGLRRCGDALGRGDGLLIFPEGTRSLTGEMQPFRIGVSVLAVERSVPIVPVHIDRTYDLFPKGRRFIHPGVVTVRFGKPIHPPELKDDDDHYEAFRTVTAELEAAVQKLARSSARREVAS